MDEKGVINKANKRAHTFIDNIKLNQEFGENNYTKKRQGTGGAPRDTGGLAAGRGRPPSRTTVPTVAQSALVQ